MKAPATNKTLSLFIFLLSSFLLFGNSLAASITGTVTEDTDADGKGDVPLESAVILLLDTNGFALASTLTDVSGVYEFSSVPAGDYVVVETNVPSVPFDVNDAEGDPQDNTIELTLGSNDKTGQDFVDGTTAITLGSISGFVLADTDKDNAGDIPLKDIVIQLKTPASVVLKETLTDVNGFYTFENLAACDYVVMEMNGATYPLSINDAEGLPDDNSIAVTLGVSGGVVDNVINQDFVDAQACCICTNKVVFTSSVGSSSGPGNIESWNGIAHTGSASQNVRISNPQIEDPVSRTTEITYRMECKDAQNSDCGICFAKFDQLAEYGSRIIVSANASPGARRVAAGAGDATKMTTILPSGFPVNGFGKAVLAAISNDRFANRQARAWTYRFYINFLGMWPSVMNQLSQWTDRTVKFFIGHMSYINQSGTKIQEMSVEYDSNNNPGDPSHFITSNQDYTLRVESDAAAVTFVRERNGASSSGSYASGYAAAIGVSDIFCIPVGANIFTIEPPKEFAAWTHANFNGSPFTPGVLDGTVEDFISRVTGLSVDAGTVQQGSMEG